MTVQTKLPQALFPDLPKGVSLVDENGHTTYLWKLYFEMLSISLHTNFSNEGLRFPPLSATDIANIAAKYAPFIGQPYQDLLKSLNDISGTAVFDTTNRVPKMFIITYNSDPVPLVLSAAWKTFTLT